MSDDNTASVDEAAEVAEMTEAEKQELRQHVIEIKQQVENSYFDFAEGLHKVWNSSLFVEWGYDSFPAYVEGELEYTPRTAQYLVRIADYFGKMNDDIREWVKSLGWSKAKELVKRVTPENFAEMKEKVAGKTVSQIQAMLKADKDAASDTEAEEESEEKAKRMSFSLFPDQTKTVNDAIERAKADGNTDKDGHALTLIATDFLAQGETTLSARLEAIEKTFGVKLIAVKEEDDGVSFPYGEATLDALTEEPDEGGEED